MCRSTQSPRSSQSLSLLTDAKHFLVTKPSLAFADRSPVVRIENEFADYRFSVSKHRCSPQAGRVERFVLLRQCVGNSALGSEMAASQSMIRDNQCNYVSAFSPVTDFFQKQCGEYVPEFNHCWMRLKLRSWSIPSTKHSLLVSLTTKHESFSRRLRTMTDFFRC